MNKIRSRGLVGVGSKLGVGLSGLGAYVVQAQHRARAYGLGPRPVPALPETLSGASHNRHHCPQSLPQASVLNPAPKNQIPYASSKCHINPGWLIDKGQ